MKPWHKLLIASLVVAVLATALALIAPGRQGSLAVGTTIYVDADATGLNDGSSWADAYTDLQLALDAAIAGREIWVAEGVYKPTQEFSPGDPRSATFQMKNGVALYGGFAGTEGSLAERDWVLHETILSGDIGTEGDDSDNSYHVFHHPWKSALDSTAILDGFTVTGGNADGSRPHDEGGGMANYNSSPTLINCTFLGNSALFGGGMYNDYSSPVLANCTFEGNSASDGGGMANVDSAPVLTNCTFEGNSAKGSGGMANYGSLPALANCTFSGNSAVHSGGGMANQDSAPVLTNCTFEGNSAGSNGGGMYNEGFSSPALTNCTFSGNSAGSGGGMYNYLFFTSPVLTNCILWGDNPDEIANEGRSPVATYSDIQGGFDGVGNIEADPRFVDPNNGDFHLGPGSPCIDAGNNAAPDLPKVDFESDARILDGDCDGTATVDMGVDEVAVAGTCFRSYLPVVLGNAP